MTFLPDPPAEYRWPRRPTLPSPPLTQDQTLQRGHRRNGLCLQYRERFDLALEVEQVTAPLAAAVAVMPNPAVMGGRVAAVFDACHELAVCCVDTVVGSAAAAAGSRGFSAQRLADLAAKPAPPKVTEEMLRDGSWAEVLTEYVAPLSGDLSAVLGRALPPNDVRLKGRLAASERLNNALLQLDRAAVQLHRSTEVTDRHQRQPSLAERQAERRRQRESRAVERRLARLGIAVNRTNDSHERTSP